MDKRDHLYRWVWAPGPGRDYSALLYRDRLWGVGIYADGTLRNPRGYPEDVVREAVTAAIEQQRQRRSWAAQRAAATRRKRHDIQLDVVAMRIREGHTFGPRHRCYKCDKLLTDSRSIELGIGSDCWQRIMCRLEALTTAAVEHRFIRAVPGWRDSPGPRLTKKARWSVARSMHQGG